MSHFTVMVIGNGDLANILASFHEFECTGEDNEFVQDIDITDEARKEHAAHLDHKVRAPDGTVFDEDDERFYRKPTEDELKIIGTSFGGSGHVKGMHFSKTTWSDGVYETRVYELPVDHEKFQENDKTFEQFVTYYYGFKAARAADVDTGGDHKFGYTLLDDAGDVVKVINRTNPNKEWDWFVLGGRWPGMLKLKPGSTGECGEIRRDDGPREADRCDGALKKDIDVDGMRRDAEDAAGKAFDSVAHIFEGHPMLPSWTKTVERHLDGIDKSDNEAHSKAVEAARVEYFNHPVTAALREAKMLDHFGSIDEDWCNGDRAAYVSRARAIRHLCSRSRRQVVRERKDGVVGHVARRQRATRLECRDREADRRHS